MSIYFGNKMIKNLVLNNLFIAIPMIGNVDLFKNKGCSSGSELQNNVSNSSPYKIFSAGQELVNDYYTGISPVSIEYRLVGGDPTAIYQITSKYYTDLVVIHAMIGNTNDSIDLNITNSKHSFVVNITKNSDQYYTYKFYIDNSLKKSITRQYSEHAVCFENVKTTAPNKPYSNIFKFGILGDEYLNVTLNDYDEPFSFSIKQKHESKFGSGDSSVYLHHYTFFEGLPKIS